jgi:hypothetical protein
LYHFSISVNCRTRLCQTRLSLAVAKESQNLKTAVQRNPQPGLAKPFDLPSGGARIRRPPDEPAILHSQDQSITCRLLREMQKVAGKRGLLVLRNVVLERCWRYIRVIYGMRQLPQDADTHTTVCAKIKAGGVIMFTKSTIALAIIIGTISGTLAAEKKRSVPPSQDAYDVRSNYVGSDPDAQVRFELRRDWERGKN